MEARAGQLARAAGTVMAAFLLSRLLGLAREIIIARQFGTSLELAAYLAAFRVPDLIFQLIAGGALGSAFIPAFTGYLATGHEREAWRLASAVFNLLLLILSGIAVIAAILAPWLANLIVPGFDREAQTLTAQLMRWMLVAPVIFGLSGLVMGILNSYQHFLLPALAPAIYNLAIIAGALFLAPLPGVGVRGLVMGVVAGSALHLLIQVPMLISKGLSYVPTLGLNHPGVREVGRLMLPRTLGLAAVQLNFLVNTVLASGLGAQALPALNYAWLLMLLPQGIIAQAIGTAVFPTLSALAARDELAELRRTFSGALRTVLYLATPAGIGLIVLRVPVVRVLLERGRFTEASTEAVALALGLYALGLFAHAGVEIAARTFYALHDTRTPVLIGAAAMAGNVLLSLSLIRTPLTFGGLALANSLATTLELIALLWVLRPRLGGVDGRRLASSLIRILASSTAMAVVAVWTFGRLASLQPLVALGAAVITGALTYLGASALVGSEEVWAVGRLVRRAVPGPVGEW